MTRTTRRWGSDIVPVWSSFVCDGILRALLLGLLFPLFACPPGVMHNVNEATTPAPAKTEIPETAEECLAIAEKLGVEGSSQAELESALEALERVEQMNGVELELLVKQLRIVYLIAAPLSKNRARVTEWLARGRALAHNVIKAAPNRVEGHYYGAIFLGYEAQCYKLRALDLLPQIVEAGQQALDIDETYDDAGSLMLMGSVLINAPAWPHGIGDPEEGLELLRRAVSISDYPVNRIILAKALLEEEMVPEACEHLDKALLSRKVGRWGKTWARHRPEAWALWNNYRCYR